MSFLSYRRFSDSHKLGALPDCGGGDIKLISMDSKILKGADHNKASSFREAIALMFALISNEAQIKSHESQVIVLTDCIGLSQILSSSNNNSRLLEFAVFLGTFSNLSVR